jgi:hypothetical protein
MSDLPAAPTIEALMAATSLTKRQCYSDVRAGLLPGRIRRGRWVCPPGEFAAYVAGDWHPRTPPQPVSLLHTRKSA